MRLNTRHLAVCVQHDVMKLELVKHCCTLINNAIIMLEASKCLKLVKPTTDRQYTKLDEKEHYCWVMISSVTTGVAKRITWEEVVNTHSS